MNRKYTFVEFVAALECDDFDVLEESWLKWAKEFVSHLNTDEVGVHYGDCTNQPISCYLCVIETLLKDYREYYFNEERWRKENL